MKILFALTLTIALLLVTGIASAAANPDGSFSGPGILTNYQAPGKPTKEKLLITLEFNSTNLESTFQVNDDPFPSDGSGYVEGRYMYVKYQTGAVVLAGRLLIKGNPGSETGLSGILTATHNGYAGMYEFKVNLKRQP